MKIKILFVCMGNICRSPTAEGVFRHLVQERNLHSKFEIDSAGTHAYHIGNAPDARSAQTAKQNGVSLTGQKARQVHESDFYYYDYIIAMDADNRDILLSNCPAEFQHKISLLLGDKSVPDPYYENNFELVFDLVYNACEKLLKKHHYD
jgi:protein-tyrosine phosphatase